MGNKNIVTLHTSYKQAKTTVVENKFHSKKYNDYLCILIKG